MLNEFESIMHAGGFMHVLSGLYVTRNGAVES